MENVSRISVEECCIYYSIETSFMQQLDEYGLIELSHSDNRAFIAHEQFSELEKYIHLHYDLEINMEGIEAIKHLLQRMQQLQQELKRLQGQLGQD